MSKKEKPGILLLQDALLDISEQDAVRSRELLSEAGIDADAVMRSSMAKVQAYRLAFEDKISGHRSDADILKSVQAKIKNLIAKSPERADNFLNGYFTQHALPVRFASTAGFNKKKLEEIKDKISLADLSKKLDEETNR